MLHQTTRHLMTAVLAPLLLFTLPAAAATFTENVTIDPTTGVVTGLPGVPILQYPTLNLPSAVTINAGDQLELFVSFTGSITVTKDSAINQTNGVQVIVGPALFTTGPLYTSTLTLTGITGSINRTSLTETEIGNALVGDVFGSSPADLTSGTFSFTGFELDVTLLASPFYANSFNASNFNFSVDYADTSVAPLPAALPLFATGLGGLGLLGWRRKRKVHAI
jgi:hypothetical protein